MRRVCAAIAVVAVLAGCSSPEPRPTPVLHDPTYHELTKAPPFVAKPVGAAPSVEKIKHDVFAWTYVNTLDPDTAKVEYEGPQAAPPFGRKEPPTVTKGELAVTRWVLSYSGPVYSVEEKQPANVVNVWINGGLGFKRHAFYYVEGELQKVD